MLEILDETIPAYDFEKLYAENKETLLGRYIEKFAGCEEGSVEYCALCEERGSAFDGKQDIEKW